LGEWAFISYLGVAFRTRVRGALQDNIENAIWHSKHARSAYLLIATGESGAQSWIGAQINLGRCYRQRIRGGGDINIEYAIRLLRDVVSIAEGELLADAQDALGLAYRGRLRGSQEHNLDLALKAHLESLKIWTRDGNVERWASATSNLALAFASRSNIHETTEYRDHDLERAREYFEEVLTYYLQGSNYRQIATVRTSLSQIYISGQYGKQLENIELAMAMCEAVANDPFIAKDSELWAIARLQRGLAIQLKDKIERNYESDSER
jgi:hypothetical protein